MKSKLFFLSTATLVLATALTFSCSGGDDGGSGEQTYKYCIADNQCLEGPFTASTCTGQLSNSCPGGSSSSNPVGGSSSSSDGSNNIGSDGEGYYTTYSIKNITGSSFTEIDSYYDCNEDGTFEIGTEDEVVSYSITGNTLSLRGREFTGNSTSLIGTWTRQPYPTCSSRCSSVSDGYSKVVFTQNSITYTNCMGKAGDEFDMNTYKIKVIDCNTWEYSKESEKVTMKVSGTKGTATYKVTITYNGETCIYLYPSETQMRSACTEAYNKATAEGYTGGGDLVYDYYRKTIDKDLSKCFEDKGIPQWFINADH